MNTAINATRDMWVQGDSNGDVGGCGCGPVDERLSLVVTASRTNEDWQPTSNFILDRRFEAIPNLINAPGFDGPCILWCCCARIPRIFVWVASRGEEVEVIIGGEWTRDGTATTE